MIVLNKYEISLMFVVSTRLLGAWVSGTCAPRNVSSLPNSIADYTQQMATADDELIIQMDERFWRIQPSISGDDGRGHSDN